MASRERLRVAVVGATGYTGAETLRWCLGHPQLDVVGATSRKHAGKTMRELWAHLPEVPITEEIPAADVLFLCLPHGEAAKLAPSLSARIVIDLSGDHRLPAELHAKHYGFARVGDPWVYGLPELGAARLLGQTRIANPGCFATALALALWPAAGAFSGRVQATGLTGSTGSGATPAEGTHHPLRAENLRPYKVLAHQHVPEVEQVVPELHLDFVPISAPVRRGILVCTQLSGLAAARWHEAYAGNPLVRVSARPPELLDVLGSPRAHIGVVETTHSTAVFCAIDNLCRGAGSQAVSNLNLAMGWPVDLGLHHIPAVP
jgi:N-acetyl-gamma-glutamyl-phosphate reductase